MQQVDYTTLTAACCELKADWLPARVEQIWQGDRFTLGLHLRTLDKQGWLTLSWHPQAARLCMGTAPAKEADTFTFSEQLRHQLKGLALIAITPITSWERVIDLQLGKRPQGQIDWHLYVEIMGKYSNVILVNAEQRIVTAAHQVSAQQSSVRPIQTGDLYQPPPPLTDPIPTLAETFAHWQERVALIPGPLRINLLKTYRGLSSALVITFLEVAKLKPDIRTEQMSTADWQRLFQFWQQWLTTLATASFTPGFRAQGYSVLGWGITQPSASIQSLLDEYYRQQTTQQTLQQLHHQLQQKVESHLRKLQLKAHTFTEQLAASRQADLYRDQADLLMAHLHHWQPGMTTLTLPDFYSGMPQQLTLNPQKMQFKMPRLGTSDTRSCSDRKPKFNPSWPLLRQKSPI